MAISLPAADAEYAPPSPDILPPGSIPIADRRWRIGIGLVLAMVAVVVGNAIVQSAWQPAQSHTTSAASLTASHSASPAHARSATKSAKPKTPKVVEAPQEVSIDQSMRDDSWRVIRTGDLYGKYADHGDVTCGMYDCVGYYVYSVNGCPTSLHVEAAVESGGSVVGMANKLLPAVQPGQPASVLLEDYEGAGDSFRITKVNCY